MSYALLVMIFYGGKLQLIQESLPSRPTCEQRAAEITALAHLTPSYGDVRYSCAEQMNPSPTCGRGEATSPRAADPIR